MVIYTFGETQSLSRSTSVWTWRDMLLRSKDSYWRRMTSECWLWVWMTSLCFSGKLAEFNRNKQSQGIFRSRLCLKRGSRRKNLTIQIKFSWRMSPWSMRSIFAMCRRVLKQKRTKWWAQWSTMESWLEAAIIRSWLDWVPNITFNSKRKFGKDRLQSLWFWITSTACRHQIAGAQLSICISTEINLRNKCHRTPVSPNN